MADWVALEIDIAVSGSFSVDREELETLSTVQEEMEPAVSKEKATHYRIAKRITIIVESHSDGSGWDAVRMRRGREIAAHGSTHSSIFT